MENNRFIERNLEIKKIWQDGKVSGIETKIAGQIMRQYYEEVDKHLILNMPQDILENLYKQTDVEIKRRMNLNQQGEQNGKY